ncbi:MAG: prolyl oligopeptidase family serine peptidase [Clostridia bacterium]|nr:prolyl oligopeptidase family serine peptidase [Clostridia bacterium]
MKHKTVTAIILTILCLLSLVSCTPPTSGGQTTTTTTQSFTQPSQTGVVVEGKGVFNNVDYTLYIPSSYNADKEAPLLVALHGGGQGTMNDAKDNRQFFADYTGLNAVAEKYGFIVAYPRQSTENHYYGYDYWNWYLQQSKKAKEPTAIYNIVGEIKRAYCIDDSRVFICGLSAGAAMAQIVAINYNTTFAGCCAVAGLTFESSTIYGINDLQAYGPSIEPSLVVDRIYEAMGAGRVPAKLLVVTGTADTRVNPKNSTFMAETWASTLARLEGKINHEISTELTSEVHTGIDGVEYKKSIYATLDNEEYCTLYEVVDMGHSWPGSSKGISISITTGEDLGYKGGIDLNEVMCEFFGLNK